MHSVVVLFSHMAARARGAGIHRWSVMMVLFSHMVVRFVVVSGIVLTRWRVMPAVVVMDASIVRVSCHTSHVANIGTVRGSSMVVIAFDVVVWFAVIVVMIAFGMVLWFAVTVVVIAFDMVVDRLAVVRNVAR